jgi:protein-S-isoprenylcysteine O-methyltransferase Ste14
VIHVAAIALGFLVQWAAPVRIVGSGRRFALMAGCVLLGIAVGLIAWTATVMLCAGTTSNPTLPTTALVTQGPFRFRRNPLYLAWGSSVSVWGPQRTHCGPLSRARPAAFLMRRLVIDKEERYVDGKFGAEYQDYKDEANR